MSVKSVFVVGGASGIGLETARHFLSQGAATTIIDVNAERVRDAESALSQKGARLAALAADVRDRQSLDRAFAQGAGSHGGIDALVFTAGVLLPARLADITEADYDLTFDVNARGFWRCVQAALPYFPERGGSVVAVSSSSGHRPKAGNGAYAASKTALQFLAQTFSLELAPRQLRVNCVAPSTIRTPLTEKFAGGQAEGGFTPSAAPPLGRLCTTADIVKATAFLCSEEASFITGATIAVDGGLTAGIPLAS
ncbi:3-oxoacyl-ACP reductase [Agaricicola taiwanensis]|uniref:3-oxoacyl-ACP reductase n=1 Tax=Agaricicola taiwanensis TaxID=591372 RepID=A0A8J2YL99_9RHOB|nr:SDR family oxidoreductase [Agaricicola taiwanensis]GGE51625.1 3-oxoacyl-ACP reductase [Agaricicola taiwanensis]